MPDISQTAATDLFRAPAHDFLEVEGGALAYRKAGSGPDLLFVHGWPVHSATWRRLLPHLAPHFTCHFIDLLGAGSSRFGPQTRIDLPTHVASIRGAVDQLGLDDVALVGHDSGGMLARHAMAGDPRLRALGLINTEQSQGLHWRFRQFLAMARLPGFASILGWVAMRPRLRRSPMLFGDCFSDRSLLEGEFEEFFLRPLNQNPALRAAAATLARGFDLDFVHRLGEVHARIEAPVRLVWGEHDPFFPLDWARDMVSDFPNASLEVVTGAKLFVHEERPAEVSAALLPVLAANSPGVRGDVSQPAHMTVGDAA